ncbi:MAG: hypothetical protein EHM48_00395 [Planctomycetaceae bacterium]|nr:MAG: hypothetical protein EHM48_00395 [Planctomycetaceae bacterium]
MGAFENQGGGLVKVYGVTAGGTVVPLQVDANGVALMTDAERACTTPTVYNIVLTLADTEYSQALPAGTRKFAFRARTFVDARYAFVTGKVATPTAPYCTLKAGAENAIDGVNLAAATLYLASGTAGTVIEIEVWA